MHPGPLGHHRAERLLLDRLLQGSRGRRVADPAQPSEAVAPVQQVRVALVLAEHLDEALLPVGERGDERSRAAAGLGRGAQVDDRHACVDERLGDPLAR